MGVSLADFHAYMPMHSYIYAPSREMWPAGSVNARVASIPLLGPDGKPALDRKKQAESGDRHDVARPQQAGRANDLGAGLADADPQPADFRGRLDRAATGDHVQPLPAAGDQTPATPAKAGPWLDHVHKVFATTAEHIVRWLAHRVQRPHEKINHALVLGGRKASARIRCSNR